MKLRTRLFIWIGSLFFLFALISYGMENILVYRHLKESKKEMNVAIQKKEEQTRVHFEGFLGIVLSEFQAQVDALLYRLEEYSALKAKFLKRGPYGAWIPSSLLLLENKWIDFLQNSTSDSSLVIMPNFKALFSCEKKVIDEDLAWIHFYEDPNDKAYIGIRITSEEIEKYIPYLADFEAQSQPDEYLFYEPQKLLSLDFKIGQKDLSKIFSQKEISVMKDFQQIFLKKIEKAKNYLSTHWVGTIEKEYFKNQPDEPVFPPHFLDRMDPNLSNIVFQEFAESLTENIYQDQIIRQIWKLCIFLSLDIFDDNPLSTRAPLGLVSTFSHKNSGAGFFSYQVMSNTNVFDSAKYFNENRPKENAYPIPSSLALIKNPSQDRLFLGNTLMFNKESYLTLAIDISDTLQKLSLASNETALLVHNNKILTVYNPRGTHLRESPFYRIDVQDLKKDKGIVRVDGENYYYLRLEPYENSNLDFYILELESKAFSFVNYIIEEVTDLISKVTYSMWGIGVAAFLISLALLHNIAKKVSEPISHLAKVTEPIAEGHYEKVEIPKIPFGPSKEVKILCQSFGEMVKGLKDKEKVRGVLNKVVSKQIAEEILKGAIKLGGEEKIVTIFFADIRDFTKITEKMSPHEVIEMLNATMTKISHSVDQFSGVIDKYVGDEVMALFGAPIEDENSSYKAVVAAKTMIDDLNSWNQQRKKENKPEIHIGVGIHTGVVVAGNMGAENRLNYTVLGSNVNLAARICDIAESDQILVTEDAIKHFKEKVDVEKLDPVTLKGFTDPITVYRIKNVT
ncbi:MAG: hypothetical protein COT84_05770 [Chlamydiae bacterium CG10_big_fil_rev_8_21_14_0_10_35_9]|nr:MAG: hypothetical protein COT84_05770 [Chlamydiae bacterium CG10_big_fil_rev_8_21_14_0_10_35_9]